MQGTILLIMTIGTPTVAFVTVKEGPSESY